MEWKEKAEDLYFKQHKKIVEIATILDRDRKTISTFLASQEGFDAEKEYRKEVSKTKRIKDKKEWEKKNRSGRLGNFEKEILKRQHEVDVMVLSAEKY